jgi:type IV secretion system protein VirB1
MGTTISAIVILVKACAPSVDVNTALAVVSTESSFNPYAIGVVGDSLVRQPRTRAEALSTIAALERDGYDYSLGYGQINKRNFRRLRLTANSALDGCGNLRAMQTILQECYRRAGARHRQTQQALRAALSCYYSGNFQTGFDEGYVERVVRAAARMKHRTDVGGGGAVLARD